MTTFHLKCEYHTVPLVIPIRFLKIAIAMMILDFGFWICNYLILKDW